VSDSKEVTLAGGAGQQVSFKATATAPGKQLVEVNGLLGAFTVKGDVPPQQQVPLPATVTEPAKPGPAQPSTPVSPTSLAENTSTTGSNAWIYAVVGGVIIILAVGTVYFMRREKGVKA
jgi:cobalamin biosynthesis Mg chelatase CobN